MAIVLTKPKPKQVETPVLSDFADLIDTIGLMQPEAEKINAKIKELQEKLKPYKAAQAELLAACETLDLDDDHVGHVEMSEGFRLELGKRGTSRSIKDLQKVRELMGDELFLQCATVPMKDIDSYLTLPQRDECLDYARTARSFKVVRR